MTPQIDFAIIEDRTYILFPVCTTMLNAKEPVNNTFNVPGYLLPTHFMIQALTNYFLKQRFFLEKHRLQTYRVRSIEQRPRVIQVERVDIISRVAKGSRMATILSGSVIGYMRRLPVGYRSQLTAAAWKTNIREIKTIYYNIPLKCTLKQMFTFSELLQGEK